MFQNNNNLMLVYLNLDLAFCKEDYRLSLHSSVLIQAGVKLQLGKYLLMAYSLQSRVSKPGADPYRFPPFYGKWSDSLNIALTGCLTDDTCRQNFEHYVAQMLQTWAQVRAQVISLYITISFVVAIILFERPGSREICASFPLPFSSVHFPVGF